MVYYYGSFELQALQRIEKKVSDEQKLRLNKIIENSFNLLNIFNHNVYPPTYSNSLKEIARFLKFEWTEKDASGMQCTVCRYNWEITKSNDLKQKILQYNIEDCRALKVVKDWLQDIEKSEISSQHTKSIKSENIFKWGITNYIVKDFEEINSKAYFDYCKLPQKQYVLKVDKNV